MPKSRKHLRAIGIAIAGFTSWVLADVCMKLAGEAALPPNEVVGFIGLTGAIFMVLKALPKGKVRSLWPKHPKVQLCRALMDLVGLYFCVIALNHLPLAVFYVVVFMAPMLIAILASLFLGEHLSRGKIIAVIVGFIGVVIGVDPFHDIARGDWLGCAAALGSTTCFAINVTWLRVITRSESNDSIAFFNGLVQTVGGFSLLVIHAEPISAKTLLILICMGLFCVSGNVANYAALRATTATNVAQFHYTQIIAGALFGYLIWHDVPAVHLIVGAAIIILSGLYIAAHAHKAENVAAVSPR